MVATFVEREGFSIARYVLGNGTKDWLVVFRIIHTLKWLFTYSPEKYATQRIQRLSQRKPAVSWWVQHGSTMVCAIKLQFWYFWISVTFVKPERCQSLMSTCFSPKNQPLGLEKMEPQQGGLGCHLKKTSIMDLGKCWWWSVSCYVFFNFILSSQFVLGGLSKFGHLMGTGSKISKCKE